ncbi:MAG: hypothetical protein SFV54_07980 [Bryobacteraceae bacterium]|nr:hypothetical protein [Bryobacteraceae bacterium]
MRAWIWLVLMAGLARAEEVRLVLRADGSCAGTRGFRCAGGAGVETPFAGRWVDGTGYAHLEVGSDGTFAVFDELTLGLRGGGFEVEGPGVVRFAGRECGFRVAGREMELRCGAGDLLTRRWVRRREGGSLR